LLRDIADSMGKPKHSDSLAAPPGPFSEALTRLPAFRLSIGVQI
jgi:hypothetical protein